MSRALRGSVPHLPPTFPVLSASPFTALTAADPLLVIRRHVDFLRIGSAICLPRPLITARHS
jgi:hypothetical protein